MLDSIYKISVRSKISQQNCQCSGIENKCAYHPFFLRIYCPTTESIRTSFNMTHFPA